MVSPPQFFVSLAQVSGAVVGFIIAISIALYSVERRERAERTQALREDIVEFRDRFERGLGLMMRVIEDSTHEEANVRGYRLEGQRQTNGISGVKQLANNNSDSKVAAIYYQLYALKEAIEPIDRSISTNEMEELLSDIDEKHSELKDNIRDKDDFGLKLYMELSNRWDRQKIPDDHMIVPNTLTDEGGEFGTWLITELEKEGHSINNPHERIQRQLEPKDGRLQYIDTILRLSTPLLRQMKDRKKRGLINNDQLIGQIIRLSVVFALVSIVLPLILILTVPEFLFQWFSSSVPEFLIEWFNNSVPPGLAIFIIESLILLLAVAIAIPLVEVPLKRVAGKNGTSSLSAISRLVTWCVDRPFYLFLRIGDSRNNK
jgi:hypothetical protein